MKICLCLLAFIAGLMVTVTVNPKDETSAEPDAESLVTEVSVEDDLNHSLLRVEERHYGVTQSGDEVTEFICTNKNGLTLEMINYGATVTSIKTPDRRGEFADITLHCNDMLGYEACTSYFGSTVGRFCNRIAKGRFKIDGKEFVLATNNGPNHLHGGSVGFDKRMWTAKKIKGDGWVGVRFQISSPDGDEGYPGKLSVTADYILNNANEVIVEFDATTDKPTHVNLTNHCYWNLAGAGEGTIYEHLLKLESNQYLPVDPAGIPRGSLTDVEETPFDFTIFHSIGSRLQDVGGEPGGYDHCFALKNPTGSLVLAATVKEPKSGRVMEIHTTQPGIQFYSGNFLDGQPGSGGFAQHHAFCLETQHFPDAPNQTRFPSTLLLPGKKYSQKTVHKFSVAQ